MPVLVRSRESNTAVRYLLSRHNDEDDSHSSLLPVSAMVWSTLSALSSQVASATAASPLLSTTASDGFAVSIQAVQEVEEVLQVFFAELCSITNVDT